MNPSIRVYWKARGMRPMVHILMAWTARADTWRSGVKMWVKGAHRNCPTRNSTVVKARQRARMYFCASRMRSGRPAPKL